MRLFDDDKVGCYLDAIRHRVDKTADGDVKVVDLRLRVQPFTAEMATALDPDVRALLFTMGDATPKPKIKAIELALRIPMQRLVIYAVPDIDRPSIALGAAAISRPRARTQKDVDGYGFVFYATLGPLDGAELDFIQRWHTEQRFVTFEAEQADLPLVAAASTH